MGMAREKRPLTPEEKAEKRQLRALYEKCKTTWELDHQTKLTQERLGALVGEMINGKPMGQAAVWQYFSEESRTKLNDKIVLALAALLGFDPIEVSGRFGSGISDGLLNKYGKAASNGPIAEMIAAYKTTPEDVAGAAKGSAYRVGESWQNIEEVVGVPRYRIALAAGAGNAVQHEESDTHLHFQRGWLRKKRLPVTKLKALDVSGDSMEPRISSGDVVLINSGDTKIKDNCIYAIRYGDSVKIKRLSVRFDGAVILTSDNPNSKGATEEVVRESDLDQLQIIGRAVWVGGDLS